MDIFIQQIMNGLVLGSIYALIALGYTMVYGILGIINFAHGEVLMVGALTALTAIKAIQSIAPGLPEWLILVIATLIAMTVCGALSFTIERVAYRPLRNAPRLAPLITAIGVSIMLQTLAMIIWSRNPLIFPELLPSDPIDIGQTGATITGKEIVIIIMAFLVMAGLLILVNRTKLGRAMRATAENPKVAGLMMATNYGNAHFYMGFIPGLKAFTAAVLGGIGNLAGAMIGGILLGLIEALGAGYIGDITGGLFGSNYQDVFAFIVLITVLVFRPSGIMGERVADRA